jgi:hypothetical protein
MFFTDLQRGLDWFHRYLGGPPAPWDPEELVEGGSF